MSAPSSACQRTAHHHRATTTLTAKRRRRRRSPSLHRRPPPSCASSPSSPSSGSLGDGVEESGVDVETSSLEDPPATPLWQLAVDAFTLGAVPAASALAPGASLALANGLCSFATRNEDEREQYAEYTATALPRRTSRLFEGQKLAWDITNAQATSPTTVVVRWRATWVRPGVVKVADFARGILRLRDENVRYFDLLDKAEEEQQRQGLVALLRILGGALVSREIKLPLSCVEGVVTLTFDPETRLVVSAEESISLLNLLKSSRLRHRRVALDLQAFLDTHRRPVRVQLERWDSLMRESSYDWNTVPGLRALLPGMPAGSGEVPDNFEATSRVLSIITLAVLCGGIAIGANYLQRAASEQMIADALINGT
ncbi:hypothetical protein NFJ02_29g69600 [Pycnococcus provasolii]